MAPDQDNPASESAPEQTTSPQTDSCQAQEQSPRQDGLPGEQQHEEQAELPTGGPTESSPSDTTAAPEHEAAAEDAGAPDPVTDATPSADQSDAAQTADADDMGADEVAAEDTAADVTGDDHIEEEGPWVSSAPAGAAPAEPEGVDRGASDAEPVGAEAAQPAGSTGTAGTAEAHEIAEGAETAVDQGSAAETSTHQSAAPESSASETPAAETPAQGTSATASPFGAFNAVGATSLLFHAPEPEDIRAALERAEREREESRLREVQEEEQAEEAEYEDPEPGAGITSRRRRRRRRGSEDMELTGGDDGDPEQTVTRIRTSRVVDGSAPTTVQSVKGSTRLEAKKQRRRESRQTGRRRQVITEAEFLARRESVERRMVVRQKDDRIQIGVLEDGVLAEHFVSHTQQDSLIGNVYLGKVQNVLPSMEAAFVDIGRGRNAVLYAGEVNWDQADLSGGAKRIENALKPGDPVLVQATKDPVGHKGARLTSQISLPGRYLVYVPGGSMTGISRKLPDVERQRLKKILKDHLPEGAGVIVRTAAEGASEQELSHDINRLRSQWEQIQEKSKQGRTLAPELLYSEPDLTIKTVRDVFNEDFTSMTVQGEDAWDSIEAYVTYVAPDLLDRVEKWTGSEDLFTHFQVDDQIHKALERKVLLPSGGSLVIDRTEAMTVVDVNTGKFTGSGGNLEETVTKNNLEAAEEIVRQLRLRDIGGIIVIDFIDMVLEANRDLVLRRLVECLGRDRTKHQVAEVTSLGLVQMTRKRMGTGLLEVFSEPCEGCDGRGVVVHDNPLHGGGASSDSRQNRGDRNDRKRGRRLGGRDDAQPAPPQERQDPEQVKRAETTRNALAAIASASHHEDSAGIAQDPAQEQSSRGEPDGTRRGDARDDQTGRIDQDAQDEEETREGAKRRRKRRGKRSRGRGQDEQGGQDAPERQPDRAAEPAQDEPARQDRDQDEQGGARQGGQARDESAQDGSDRRGRGRRDGDRARTDRTGGQRAGRGGTGRGDQGGSRSEDETRSLIAARLRSSSDTGAVGQDAVSGSDEQAASASPETSTQETSPQETSSRRGRRTRTARSAPGQAPAGRSEKDAATRARVARATTGSAPQGSVSPSEEEVPARDETRTQQARTGRGRSAPTRTGDGAAPERTPGETTGSAQSAPARTVSAPSSPVQATPAQSGPMQAGPGQPEARQRPRRARRAAAPAGTPSSGTRPAPSEAAEPRVTTGSASVVSESDGTSKVTINGEVIELPQGQTAAEALRSKEAASSLDTLASTLGERDPGTAGPLRRPRRSRRASAPAAAPGASSSMDGGPARGGTASDGSAQGAPSAQ